jgi:hypothetical protein
MRFVPTAFLTFSAAFVGFVSSVAIADAREASGFRSEPGQVQATIQVYTRYVFQVCLSGQIVSSQIDQVPSGFLYFEGQVPVAPGLRVRIQNVTFGSGNGSGVPFTDRGYSDGSLGLSERIRFINGVAHRGSAFVVFGREEEQLSNVFAYEIYQEATGEVVEADHFETSVELLRAADLRQQAPRELCGGYPLPLPPQPVPRPPFPRP